MKQRGYDNIHREYYAVVWAVLVSRPYMEENRPIIGRDHDFLKRIIKLSNAEACWSVGDIAYLSLTLKSFTELI